jgi:hypothetical protein
MRYLLFIATTISFALGSCKTRDAVALSDHQIDEAKIYITSVLKKFDSTSTLDSFRYLRLDTLYEKNKYNFLADDIREQIDDDNAEMKQLLDKFKDDIRMASLSSGLSNSLYQNYKGEAEDAKDKMQELQKKTEDLSEKFDSAAARHNRADSTKPLAYYGVYYYQLRHQNRSVKTDTAYVLMNLDKNIIERETFFYHIKDL